MPTVELQTPHVRDDELDMREGDRFENYLLKNKLAEGGMAEVFRAERVGAMGVTREVCIKRILPEMANDRVFVDMFIDEARIASTLRHGNIVAVEHFGLVDGVPFMAMAWVHGIDAMALLRRVHKQEQFVPVDAALYLVSELLRALEYAHGKRDDRGQWLQIVHRDVSPHNMLISFAGEVALSDFGIAKASSRLHQTRGHLVKGKIAYMAPEQAMGSPLDHRADLFAVGVVAYQLLTGRLPFGSGNDPLSSTQALLRGDRAKVRSLRAEVPEAVEAFIDRLLQLMPDDRYPDAGSARDALAAVPATATGERTLQRLVRALFDDDAFSTLSPRTAPVLQVPATIVDAAPVRLAQAHSLDATLPSVPTEPDDDAVTRAARPPLRAPQRPSLAATHAGAHPDIAPTAATSTGPFVAVSVAPPRARAALRIAPIVALVSVVAVGSAFLGAALNGRATRAAAAPPTVAPSPAIAAQPSGPAATSTAAVDAGEAVELRHLVEATAVDAGPASDATTASDRPMPMASVQVVAVPWGTVSIDGRPPVQERAVFRVPAGRHRIRAVCMGNAVVARTVNLHAGTNANELLIAPAYERTYHQ